MGFPRRTLPPFALALLTLLAVSGPGRVCNVPVFRYALDKWAPSTYTLVVFHDRELTDAQKRVLELAGPPLNAKVELIDTSAGVPKRLQARPAAEFVCAPCSCRVKELNPGVDLLLTADWKALLENPPKPAR